MTLKTYSYGELCLETLDAGRQPPPSTTAKTTATDPAPVMSAQEARFWARVDKDGPTNARRPELGPCWIWTGSRYSHKGKPTYGQTSHDGQRTTAHRASFLMHGGVVPDDMEVMHQCDTKPCVRPNHLKAGTRSENLYDGFAAPKNQGVCAGENNGRARLTWDDAHAIRAALRNGVRQAELARRYEVHPVQISNISRGKRWPESKCPIHGLFAEAVA